MRRGDWPSIRSIDALRAARPLVWGLGNGYVFMKRSLVSSQTAAQDRAEFHRINVTT